MIKEIKAYVTSDGKCFTDYDEAVKYENYLNIMSKLENFVEKYFYSGDYRTSDIYRILAENVDELKEIFKE